MQAKALPGAIDELLLQVRDGRPGGCSVMTGTGTSARDVEDKRGVGGPNEITTEPPTAACVCFRRMTLLKLIVTFGVAEGLIQRNVQCIFNKT